MKINGRDWFWLVALVALLFAWLHTYRRMESEQVRLRNQNSQLKQLAADRDTKLQQFALDLVEQKEIAQQTLKSQRSPQIKTVVIPSHVNAQDIRWSIDKGMLIDAAQRQRGYQDRVRELNGEPRAQPRDLR